MFLDKLAPISDLRPPNCTPSPRHGNPSDERGACANPQPRWALPSNGRAGGRSTPGSTAGTWSAQIQREGALQWHSGIAKNFWYLFYGGASAGSHLKCLIESSDMCLSNFQPGPGVAPAVLPLTRSILTSFGAEKRVVEPGIKRISDASFEVPELRCVP